MASSSRTSLLTILALLFFLFSLSEASEFVVGGKESTWKIPSYPDEYNKWAQSLRFQVGDSLVLKYEAKADSVLQVTEEDYNSCSTTNPIKSYDDGNSNISLDRSGPFFFISGTPGHCDKGQKVVVEVLSSKHGFKPPALSPVPAPATAPADSLAPAPKSSVASDASAMRLSFVGAVMTLASLLGLALV